MTEEEFTELLGDFICEYAHIDNFGDDDFTEDEDGGNNNYPELKDIRVKTFDRAGILTMNAGLVITLSTGEEYQVTIVRSR
jgi:hypothetical protein